MGRLRDNSLTATLPRAVSDLILGSDGLLCAIAATRDQYEHSPLLADRAYGRMLAA
jgi:hypothetical protein